MERIFICAVMPVAIVLISALTRMNNENKRAKILMKAIEANNVDADRLAELLGKPRRGAREILNARLLRGCIFGLIGLVLMLVGVANLLAGTEFGADPVTVPLLFGGVSMAVGAGYLIVYSVTRKEVRDDEC